MVTIYTKPICPACTHTKKFFERNGIEHQTVDVTKSAEALERVKDWGYGSVPVVEVDGEHFGGGGYPASRLDRLKELFKSRDN